MGSSTPSPIYLNEGLAEEAREIAGFLGALEQRVATHCDGNVNPMDNLRARIKLARLALTVPSNQLLMESMARMLEDRVARDA